MAVGSSLLDVIYHLLTFPTGVPRPGRQLETVSKRSVRSSRAVLL
jgi:hypothetical protein